MPISSYNLSASGGILTPSTQAPPLDPLSETPTLDTEYR